VWTRRRVAKISWFHIYWQYLMSYMLTIADVIYTDNVILSKNTSFFVFPFRYLPPPHSLLFNHALKMLPQSTVMQQRAHWATSAFCYRGSSHRRNGADRHACIIDVLWLHRLPIPVGRNGVFYVFIMISTCHRGAYREWGRVSTLWGRVHSWWSMGQRSTCYTPTG